MRPAIDATHDPSRRSWVETASGHPTFPLQNLPFGVFEPGDGRARVGVAIGDFVLDLAASAEAGLLDRIPADVEAAIRAPDLKGWLTLPGPARVGLRRVLVDMLDEASGGKSPDRRRRDLLHEAAGCRMEVPVHVGDYTDFYVGIHHARAVGALFRPDAPLLPNYKHVPIGYHGRSSSIVTSGTQIRRPRGQVKAPDAAMPSYAPSRRLDYELEMGIWIGPGNELGSPIPLSQAAESIAGISLLNDLSARDIQAWEYQPLGPFLAKNFATVVSPWIVTTEALAPFRDAQAPRPEGDPAPLPYLWDEDDQAHGAFSVELEAYLTTERLRRQGDAPKLICRTHSRHMYWTIAQMIAHHTSGGCNLQPGDLLGTGTISSPDREGAGSLLEATAGGKDPIRIDESEQRSFLEDGDELVLSGTCRKAGFATIGFGECRALIAGSPA